MNHLQRNRRRLLLIALVLLAFLGTLPMVRAQSGNLISNGDFSSGAAGWNGDALSGTETCCAGGYPNGAYPEAYAHPDGAGGITGLWQDIANPQAGSYSVSAWVKTSGSVQNAWVQADSGAGTTYCQSPPPRNPTAWLQISCSFTLASPAPIHVAVLAANDPTTAGGWIAWDTIVLTRSDRNLIANSDFNSNTQSWNVDPLAGAETCCAYNGGGFSGGAVPNAYAHPNGAGGVIALWQDIPNPQAGFYTLTGWIKTSAAQSVWIQADNGTVNGLYCKTNAISAASWKIVACSFRLPTAGSVVHVALIASNAAGTGSGWVTWDTIKLTTLRLPWPQPLQHCVGGYGYSQGTHTGVDAYALDFDLVNENVLAVAGGTVSAIQTGVGNTYPTLSYGNYVDIDHGGFISRYAHLSSVGVSVGQAVNQGDVIGISGNTGNSTAAHLHFALRSNTSAAALPEPMSGYAGFVAGGCYRSDN